MKKFVALSVFICCLCLFPAFGQNKSKILKSKPVSPNLPTDLSKPSEEDAGVWNEFASEKYNFWITFPAEAKKVARDNGNQFASFDVYTKKAHYGLVVRDLLVSLNNEQLEVLFESIIEETENESTTLIGEKDVYLNGFLGKELIYEENKNIVFGRFYILESKLFMLTINLPKKNYTRDFDRWATKFFDSFGVKSNVKMDAE